MEPITALLTVAASYGAGALVRALGGGRDLSSLSAELVTALADSESRIDERLAAIEAKLDELLEQRYAAALRAGVRYLLDALPAASAAARGRDLDRARDAFVDAGSAARTSLQGAVAERYLLLCLLGLRRTELIEPSIGRLEALAMAAALEAMVLAESGRGRSLRRRNAQRQVKQAALDSVGMCGRMLAETAVLAPEAGLPVRVSPPARTIEDPYVIEGGSRADDSGDLVIGSRYDYPAKGYWPFTIFLGGTLRLGPLEVQWRPGPCLGTEGFSRANPELTRPAEARPDRTHVRVSLAAAMPVPLRLEISAAGLRAPHVPAHLNPGAGSDARPWTVTAIAAAAKWAELVVPTAGSNVPVIMISPETVFRSLIEITCEL